MGKKIPQRQCVGCREMKAKKELISIYMTTGTLNKITNIKKQKALWTYTIELSH